MTPKQVLASKIIGLIPKKENNFIFGGFIRDTIAGKEFADIDMRVWSFRVFSERLKENSLVISNFRRCKNYTDENDHHKFTVTDKNGASIDIDCIEPLVDKKSASSQSVIKGNRFDADVNSLFVMVDKIDHTDDACSATNLILKADSFIGAPIKEVVSNIVRKNFVKCSTAASWRIDKLTSIGYTMVSASVSSNNAYHDAADAASKINAINASVASYDLPKNNNKKEDKNTMTTSNTQSPMNWLSQQLAEGAVQGMASTAVDVFAVTLIGGLKKSGMDEGSVMMMEMFIKTPAGHALLSALLSAGIHFIPVQQIQGNEKVQKIGDKCMQNAAATGVKELGDLVMKYVVPALLTAINPGATESTAIAGALTSMGAGVRVDAPPAIPAKPVAVPGPAADEDLAVLASEYKQRVAGQLV